MSLSEFFRPVSYDQLPGWRQDTGIAEALAAFTRSAHQAATRPYRSGSLGICFEAFAPAYGEARTMSHSADAARAFFERHFLPFHVRPDIGERGFVTGYYEPEVEASCTPTEVFSVPLYRRPDDLVDVDDGNRPEGLDPYLAFARYEAGALVAYHDRQAVERGALEGRGLELCWLADRVDAFFVHIQGAARLRLRDGGRKRVTYAAKSGHRFTGIGRLLADFGEIPLQEVTMQTIRAWLARNPQRQDDLLWQNRSYIFFRETPLGEMNLGPVAAAKVQLQPGRSIAVDRLLHTFATPFFIDAPELRHVNGEPFRRLMIAQDTGSAITGSARGDLFIGTGSAAGDVAGSIRHAADFYALLPRLLVEGA
ncbi:murein transglycosylase A [Chelativorans sp. AA-79]|uniref:murein transglycosylase A n=1 Tax=Chelativorans sp. AA-79 TaxID=3028735 RepID=UPI0023F7878C|nr:murein transglycosylase A [Chelativorans sp. AA-79]WEX09603.1 murein transglycosylase A [Chelativorans sp. AA-79]